MLIWIFGPMKEVEVEALQFDHAAGVLHLKHARVKWFLSINEEHLPAAVREVGKRTFRSLTLEDKEIEFSDGFTDLHTKSYEEILAGKSFGLEDARPSIDLVYRIRQAVE
jgi:UDP-N-acetyl-2-amino-2-deoxyglucuronate dehydrogenase